MQVQNGNQNSVLALKIAHITCAKECVRVMGGSIKGIKKKCQIIQPQCHIKWNVCAFIKMNLGIWNLSLYVLNAGIGKSYPCLTHSPMGISSYHICTKLMVHRIYPLIFKQKKLISRAVSENFLSL